jgi:radical SAM superfamily enzyme YgiQ (UPF0313 family)
VFQVALVGPELEENLSLRYLASSLEAAGFKAEIVPFNGPSDLPRVLTTLLDSGEPPALVGLSLSFQRRAKDFFALSVALRQRGYAGHITAGGHFGTFACREILRDFPEIDSICRHEAEETLVRLAQALASGSAARRSRKQSAMAVPAMLEHGRDARGTMPAGPSGPNTIRSYVDSGNLAQIPGLAYRETAACSQESRMDNRRKAVAAATALQGEIRLTDLPALPDLHKLPPPDRRGAPSECLGHRLAPLVASRGCYANCAFCCISAWHEQTQPGKRFRLRPVEDVADEMAELHHQRKIEIFIFHDDNFFLPNRAQTLKRIAALADALDRRGVRNIATIVKARPNDLDSEVMSAMRERLGLIRVYVGIETNSEQGLLTLRRQVDRAQNEAALELVERFGIYACFNLLIFDPSTQIKDLETNLAFMEKFAHVPQNFGRVELYAGTPLLASMQAQGRCRGDYLDRDYRITDDQAQRVFELAMQCFFVRNFSDTSAANLLMGTRFVVEVAARFHPQVFRPSWLTEVKRLNRELARDSVRGMREIIGFVKARKSRRQEADFTWTLAERLRATEHESLEAAGRLEAEIQNTIQDTPQSETDFSGPGGKFDETEQSKQPAALV